MTSIFVKKEILEDLLELKLRILDEEINKIVAKWNFKSHTKFLQDVKNIKAPKAKEDSDNLKKLLNQKEEISNLKKLCAEKSSSTSLFKINTNLSKIQPIIREIKEALTKLYGQRLKEVILYGSYARGEERDESDIDLAVILKGEVILYKEINRIIDVIYDINLKYNILVSVRPISEADFDIPKTSFLSIVKEEGISI
ncbi:MAG TPA: nucleotidyltransferase domain-containing protein [Candidatus Lokiarchaeia archaeon]